jgi:hypothetical protein
MVFYTGSEGSIGCTCLFTLISAAANRNDPIYYSYTQGKRLIKITCAINGIFASINIL